MLALTRIASRKVTRLCYKALKALYKEHNILVVYVFLYQYYFTFSVCLVEVGVEVAQVGLI